MTNCVIRGDDLAWPIFAFYSDMRTKYVGYFLPEAYESIRKLQLVHFLTYMYLSNTYLDTERRAEHSNAASSKFY